MSSPILTLDSITLLPAALWDISQRPRSSYWTFIVQFHIYKWISKTEVFHQLSISEIEYTLSQNDAKKLAHAALL